MTVEREYRELAAALRACRGSHLAVAVFSLFINLLMLTPAIYMLQVYDRVLASGSVATLGMLTLVVMLLFLAVGLLEWVRAQILLRSGTRFATLLEDRVFDTAYRQTLYTARSGDAPGQPLADLSGLKAWLTGNGPAQLFDLPWVPVYLLVMYWFHPWFGLFGLLAALVLVGLAAVNAVLGRQPQREGQAQAVASEAFLAKNLRNAEVIESMGMYAAIHNRWQALQHRLWSTQLKAGARGSTLAVSSRTWRLAVQSLVLGVGAYLVIMQRITPGVMIAGSILLGRALAPVDGIIAGWSQMLRARGHYLRLQALLESIPRRRERMALPPPEGRLVAEQVAVCPPGQRNAVLRGISFDIAPGQVVGVIGPSASGKTSLARVVLGIWPTTAGSMRLDGAEAYSLDRMALGPHVGYLPQDVELFEGTVSENIARFDEIDPEAVVEAARTAGVHEIILRLPQGYDSQVGVDGASLSAGQRQRIALARAVYRQPRVVVLDEPNSNLDDQGELALIQALRSLQSRGATVLVISHRRTILAAVDKLLVLRDGALVGFGDKEAVLQAMRAQLAATRQSGSAEDGA